MLVSWLAIGCTATLSKYTKQAESVHREDEVRERASFELECPPEQLLVKPLGDVITAGVEGCGKRAVYKHTGMSGWIANTAAVNPTP